MKKRHGLTVAALVLVSAFGYFPASAGEIPDLRGKWTGIWSGGMDTGMDMNVKKQEGVTVSGTITLVSQFGEDFVHPIKGKLKADRGGTFVLSIKPTDGKDVKFTFTTVKQDELRGRGESFHHEGPVTLKRSE